MISQDEKKKICKLYVDGKNLSYLMKTTGYCFDVVSRILKEGGVKKRNLRKLSSEQKEQIVSEYQAGDSTSLLARKYGVVKTNINNILRARIGNLRTGAETKRLMYPVNEHAFDVLTEESAYWIGMLMADGCITTSGGSTYVNLALAEKDTQHVRKFANFLGCVNHKITRVKRVKGGYNARFGVASKILANKLAEYGVTQRKSHTAKPSNELLFNKHFWRGVIDGDGSIAVKNKYPTLCLVGSKFICDDFANYAKYLTSVKANVYPTKTIFGWATSCSFAAIIVRELYSGCKVFLERKMPAAIEIMNWTSVWFPTMSKLLAKAKVDHCTFVL